MVTGEIIKPHMEIGDEGEILGILGILGNVVERPRRLNLIICDIEMSDKLDTRPNHRYLLQEEEFIFAPLL